MIGNDFNHEDSMNEDLTIEDILLPKKDQGDSLANQVTKAVVTDPDSDRKERPNSSYISRLQTLGGMNIGPSSSAY